jgi:hypothetical protein
LMYFKRSALTVCAICKAVATAVCTFNFKMRRWVHLFYFLLDAARRGLGCFWSGPKLEFIFRFYLCGLC